MVGSLRKVILYIHLLIDMFGAVNIILLLFCMFDCEFVAIFCVACSCCISVTRG